MNDKIRQEEKRWKLDITQSAVGVVVILLTMIQFWNMGSFPFLPPLIVFFGSGFTALMAFRVHTDKKILTLIIGLAAALLLALAVIGFVNLRR